MARLNDLRPNLDALMKEDPRAGKKTPVATPTPSDRTGGEAVQSFADRIAGRHDVQAAPRPRESKLAEGRQEPEVLLNKPGAGEKKVVVVPGKKPVRR